MPPTLATRQTRRPPKKLRQSLKIFLALVGALVLNVLALFLAVLASAHWPRHRPKISSRPLQVTIVPNIAATPEPFGPANTGLATPPPYIRTTGDQKSEETPTDAAFQSSQNTKAASELPADGDKPLPSQQGREMPTFDFDTRPYRPGKEAVDAATYAPPAPENEPKPPSEEKTVPPDKKPPKTTKARKAPQHTAAQPTPEPDGAAPSTKADLMPSLEPPAPSPQTSPEPGDDALPPPPQRPSRPQNQMPPATVSTQSSAGVPRPPGYQPQTVQTKQTGNINNRGKSAVSATGTPLGRYQKAVYDAIGMLWYYHGEEHGADIAAGSVTIHFFVARDGHVRNVKFTSGKPNGTLGIISEQSINEAVIEPIPSDVASTLEGGELEEEITFSYY